MDVKYTLFGVALLIFGIVSTILQLRILLRGDGDKLGYEKSALIYSIGMVIIGSMIIIQIIS